MYCRGRSTCPQSWCLCTAPRQARQSWISWGSWRSLKEIKGNCPNGCSEVKTPLNPSILFRWWRNWRTAHGAHPENKWLEQSSLQEGTTQNHDAKKVIFTACHSDKLYLTCTSPKVISTSLKNICDEQCSLKFFCNLRAPRNRRAC